MSAVPRAMVSGGRAFSGSEESRGRDGARRLRDGVELAEGERVMGAGGGF